MKRLPFIALFLMLPFLLLSQTTDLRVAKSGQDVLLSWTGGTANYVATYSTTPSFAYANVTLADASPGPKASHVSALADNANYFYDVAGAGEMSKAIQGGGYAPPPAPQLIEIYQYNTGTSSCTATAITAGKVG